MGLRVGYSVGPFDGGVLGLVLGDSVALLDGPGLTAGIGAADSRLSVGRNEGMSDAIGGLLGDPLGIPVGFGVGPGTGASGGSGIGGGVGGGVNRGMELGADEEELVGFDDGKSLRGDVLGVMDG